MANIDMQMIVACDLAAIATHKHIGKGDKIAIDSAAVDVFRGALAASEIDGNIINGEGELENAPALYYGEKLGSGTGAKIDITIDPVEGTSLAARGDEGSLTTIAYSAAGTMMRIPEMYMEKIFVSKRFEKVVSLSRDIGTNIKEMQKIEPNLRAIVLDKPRHEKAIKEMESLGVYVRRLPDGDVLGAIEIALGNSDIYYGIGGAPEGVLMAALAIGGGCYMEGRMVPLKDVYRPGKIDDIVAAISHEDKLCKNLNIEVNKIFRDHEFVNDKRARFFASGITAGLSTKPVHRDGEEFVVTTIMASYGSTRMIHTRYNVDTLPQRYAKLIQKYK